MFKLFDKRYNTIILLLKLSREKGSIGLNEIKQTFQDFLDFTISDSDISEFIQQTTTTDDSAISFKDLATK